MTELEDRDTVIRLIGGYMVSNAIRAAGSLGLFALADIDGGVSVDDAARAAGIDTDRLTRLIHLLQHAGLVGPSEDRINLTSQGRLLVPGREGSLSNFAQNFTSPLFQRPWDLLEDSLRTGTPGFVLTHQQTVYDYFASDDAANTLFNDAMQEEAAATARPAAMLISLAPDETVVDLGGGDGTFLRRCSKRTRPPPASSSTAPPESPTPLTSSNGQVSLTAAPARVVISSPRSRVPVPPTSSKVSCRTGTMTMSFNCCAPAPSRSPKAHG